MEGLPLSIWAAWPADTGLTSQIRSDPASIGPVVSEDRAMLDEFKKFAMRGNVVDLAVGVIIGAAFGQIVSSLVGDIFMPIIGAATGGLAFSNYYIPLSKSVTAPALADAKKQGAVLAWG